MQQGGSQPQLAGVFSRAGLGAWYAGAMPQGVGVQDRPVLVFVPGLAQTGPSWWREDEFYGMNDMYTLALADGFRTAFVSFAPPGAKPLDMWQNGRILAWQLGDICRYFRVPSVIAVAHSKGGVDAEAAAAWFGAAPLMEKLVTLSTPHWGSQLADLAYSSFAWHLAERTGAHSDGCYVMQTEYMAEFRRLTEGCPTPRSFETFAGRGGGPPLTKLWAGGLVLERFGPNDCIVTVQNAQNPRARHLMTLDYNHSQMRMGRFLWPWVRYAAAGVPVIPAEQGAAIAAVPAAAQAPQSPVGEILRGGPLTHGIDEAFYIDSTAEAAEFCVTMAGGRPPVLTGPDGKAPGAFETARARDGTVRYILRALHPAPGKWTLKAPAGQGAYLAMLRLFGMPDARPAGSGAPIGNLRSQVRVLRTLPGRIEPVAEFEQNGEALQAAAGPSGPAYALPEKLQKLDGGLYSLETTLTGELGDGSPYQRTVQRSLLVRPEHADPKGFLTAFYAGRGSRRV